MKQRFLLIAVVITCFLSAGSRAGAQWVGTIPDPLNASVYLALAVSGSNLFTETGDEVFLSTDYGRTWNSRSGFPDINGIKVIAAIDTILFASAQVGPDYNDSVLRSNDSGATWISVDSGFPQGCSGSYALAANGSGLWSSGCGVFLSTDDGNFWTSKNNGLPSKFPEGNAVQSFAFGGADIFAGLDTGVYRSTDNGEDWGKASNGLPAGDYSRGRIAALAVVGTTLLAGTPGSGVFRSTNNGDTWQAADNGLSVQPRIQSICFAVYGSNIFLGMNDSVFLSTNNGTSWLDVSNGQLGQSGLSALAVLSSYLFMSNTSAVWRRPLAEMIGTNSVSENQKLEIINVSPNPTPGLLTIRGAVGEVTVTNVLGEPVAASPSPRPSPEGEGETQLDLSKLPSGTYFARIETAGGEVVRKIMKE